MNAVQAKRLTEKAIAILDNWSNTSGAMASQLAAELRSALQRASLTDAHPAATPQRKPKGVKSYPCYWGTPGDAVAYFHANLHWQGPWKPNMANGQGDPYQRAAATREKSSLCACGHRADAHEQDELCTDCDCTHFHYDSAALQEAA